MVKRSMRLAGLLCALLSVSFGDLQAFSTAYTNGMTISANSISGGAGDFISLDGTLTVSGNVIFNAAASQTLTVSVGTVPGAPVYIQPLDRSDSGARFGHLLLCAPAADSKILFYVNEDMIFTGSNFTNILPSNAVDSSKSNDMVVTVSGFGQVVFAVKGGKKVAFESWYQPSGVLTEMTTSGSGTRIYIAMDDSLARVATAGVNKMVVQRQSWTDTFTNLNIECSVGINSLFTFVSTNSVGVSYDGESTGYAGVAFDVSNVGRGRTVLHIKGGLPMQYFDGGLNLVGHYVANQDLASTYTLVGTEQGSLDSADNIRQFTSMRHLAGREAFLRVTDDLAFADGSYSAALAAQANSEVVIGGKFARRGLLVINDCKSITAYAANPYADNGWFKQDIYQEFFGPGANALRQNYQPGFILGVNGHIDVAHNTFFDYVGTSSNMSLLPEGVGLHNLATRIAALNLDSDEVLKKHNPSALVVDGLRGLAGVGANTQIAFTAVADENRQAQITTRGNGAVTMRIGTNNVGVTDGLGTIGTDSVYSFTLGFGAYNGTLVSVAGETLGQGEVVLDIEGPLSVVSVDDNYTSLPVTNERHNGSTSLRAGTLNIPSIKVDYTNHEVLYDTSDIVTGGNYVSRPLISGDEYARYNQSAILMNADVDMRYMRINHNDVSRVVTVDSLTSEPAIVGGERAHHETTVLAAPTTILPILNLHNCNLDLHESLAVSGIRMTIRDLDMGFTGTAEPNITKFNFYNHGDLLDTQIRGFARALVLGTALNEVGNLGSNTAMKSAHLNVYRSTGDEYVITPTARATLSLRTLPEGTSNPTQQGTQVFWIGNDSTVSLGWTTTVGFRGFTGIDPFESTIDGDSEHQFELGMTNHIPATLSIDGDNFYFAGKDTDGNPVQTPVKLATDPRCIFVNHGGRIVINHTGIDDHVPFISGTDRPFNAFIDTIVAVRMAYNKDIIGMVTLPRDQVQFGAFGLEGQIDAIQPYNLDMAVLTDGFQPHMTLPFLTNGAASSQLNIAWDTISSATGFVPVKDFSTQFRSIQAITAPVTMPNSGMILVTTGDYLDQVSVSGATAANPFSLYVSGNDDGFGIIREFTSLKTVNGVVPGEGQFGSIFTDGGAKIGLGSRAFNENSANAWNLLGQRNITLFPNGDTVVELNANVIIADGGAIVPTTNFGSFADAFDGSGTTTQASIIFISEKPHEIRVPAGGELDLRAFGQAVTGTTQRNTQLISIAGNTRLVIEPGATIRFPSLSSTDIANGKRPVLYINENAELVFEGRKDRANKLPFVSPAQSALTRARILGCGQIWLNKKGVVRIYDEATVGVETDPDTPVTDLTISIQREGQFLIGDANNVGGTFQVGNMLPAPVGGINFQLRLNGNQSLFNVSRLGFFGLGTGVFDQSGSTINNWKVQSLFNVNNVNIRHIKGIMSMNSIFDGASSEGTVFAVGPIAESSIVELGPLAQMIIRGGSNMLYTTTNALPAALVTPSLLTTAADFHSIPDAVENNGIAHMVGSAPVVFQKQSVPNQDAGTTIVDITGLNATEAALIGGRLFTATGVGTNSADMFKYLSFGNYATFQTKYVDLSATKFTNRIGYVADTVISRLTNILATDLAGTKKNPAEVLDLGYLGATGIAAPKGFVVLS